MKKTLLFLVLFLTGCGCAVKIGYTIPATFFIEFSGNATTQPAAAQPGGR